MSPRTKEKTMIRIANARPYGIDSAFRDPSGNSIRLAEVGMPAEV